MASVANVLRVPQSKAPVWVYSPIIRVLVGENACEFFVHRDLVCPRSQFFSNALKEPWQEAKERKVTLVEEEASIFAVYLALLYTTSLPVKESDDLLLMGSAQEQEDGNQYVILSKLCILAEMLLDDTTKHVVLGAMSAAWEETKKKWPIYFPAATCIPLIYKGTLDDSPARQWLVRLYTDSDHIFPQLMQATFENIPKDFTFDLAVSLLATRPLREENEGWKESYLYELGENAKREERITMQSQTIATLKAQKKELKAKLARERRQEAEANERPGLGYIPF